MSQWVRVYDERTGNPMLDNVARQKNRNLHRATRRYFRVETPRGRRRKHVLTRVEGENWVRLVAAIADDLMATS